MIAPTGVKVDSGVNVLGGVAVKVAVDGTAAAVCVDAAPAVCTIKVLIALGSSGAMGAGVAMDGTHAMINAKVANQSHIFFLGDRMLSIQGSPRVLRLLMFPLVFLMEWVSEFRLV